MKDKILKAIDKGLMNVLSPDIKDQDIDFNHDNIDNEFVRYEYNTVDMGKAGIWCEYNLGAFPGNKASDWYGDYYAWGETEVKDEYSWETYKHCKGTRDAITKYNETDRLKQLKPEDDVVTQTLGNEYRMPTHNEYKKLIKNTTNEWVKNYKDIKGLNGRLFTAKNGNTLFFPAAGYYDYSDFFNAGNGGSLWSASLNSNNPDFACNLVFCFYSNYISPDDDDRCFGVSVRGIQNPI